MFSSSPTSSTNSPQLTRSHPGPPRRTYAKRKARATHEDKRIILGDSDDDQEDEQETRISSTRREIQKGSMSSPSHGSSRGNRINGVPSESRLTRTRSGVAKTPNDGEGKDVQKAETAEDGEDGDGELEEGRGTKKTNGNGRKRARMYEQSSTRIPSPSPSPRPRLPASSSPLTAISATPTPTTRRQATGGGINDISPRRSTRTSRSSSSASQPVEKEATPTRERDPATPPRSVPVAGPSTPSSVSPRDYAHLFTAYSPDASLISSPSRRRLIGESKSSGAVLDSPSKLQQRFAHLRDSPSSKLSAGPSTPTKSLGKSMSMPISPAKSLLEDAEPDPSAMWIKPPETEPGSGGRAKRIYGKSRTVVAEDIDTVSDSTKLEEALSKESYASLRSRYEVNPGDALTQAEMSLIIARAPQSANDMKSKGENRRFMDETGYLLDGIEDENATKGFRRASCVDILTNMQNEEWMSKLRVCGQTERVWSAFQAVRGDGDPIMDAVCLLTLFNITVGIGGIGTILQADAQSCVRFVIGLLKERNGVLDEKWTGKVTPNVERMREISKNIVNLRDWVTVNTRHLASSILASLASDLPDDLISPVLRSEKVLSKTLKAILPEIASLSDRFDLVESGLPLIPQDNSIDLGHIRNGLVIIDHMITASVEDRNDLAQLAIDVPRAVLQSLLAFTTFDFDETCLESHDAALGIVSCLKIFANMSNNSFAWSRSLLSVDGSLNALARVMSDRKAISARVLSIGENGANTADSTDEGELLCLVLAIVTSAALVDETISSNLAILKLNRECRIPACLRSCKCPTAEPFVNELARLYTSFHSKETSEADTEVVAAYLALLLSKVITAAPATLLHIEPSLPGDSTEARLNQLLASLRSLDFYRSTLQAKIKAEIGPDGAEWQEEGNEVQKAIDDLTRLVAESA